MGILGFISNRFCLIVRARASTPDGADAVRQLRNLCVDAEGPAAPFTKTPRGAMLVALISVVVRNVGLQDKVGALRALSLLKANDDALRRAARAGASRRWRKGCGTKTARDGRARTRRERWARWRARRTCAR